MPDQEQPFIDNTLIRPVALDDRLGNWEFAPKPDITPYELALIVQMFTRQVLNAPTGQRLDWREYLTRKWSDTLGVYATPTDLSRHFKVLIGQ